METAVLSDAALSLAVFCHRADQATVQQLLGDLVSLHLCSTPDWERPEVRQQFLSAVNGNRRFVLIFERDKLWLARQNDAGDIEPGRCALELNEFNRRAAVRSELAQACFGQHRPAGTRVLDACAGWGMDALLLANAGATLTLVERQPAMCALLRDLCRRVPANLAERLNIACAEAIDALEGAAVAGVDVIYIDPMFPTRKKGALPNKRLQFLAELCVLADGQLRRVSGEQTDEEATLELIDVARRVATRHVVLKRRKRDPLLGEPDRQVTGRTVRYDLYAAVR